MKSKLNKQSAFSAAFALSLAVTGPAFAKPATPPSCAVVSFNVMTLNCLGFFSDNLIAEGGWKLADAISYSDDLNPAATSLLEKFDIASGHDADPLNFIKPLSGQTVIGLHFGGGTGYNGTAFWLLDIPNNTDAITWSSAVQNGISNAGLYYTRAPGGSAPPPAVPEPATWAMMLLGFGAIGVAMRKKQRRTVGVSFA